MVGGVTPRGTVSKGGSVRKVENHCAIGIHLVTDTDPVTIKGKGPGLHLLRRPFISTPLSHACGQEGCVVANGTPQTDSCWSRESASDVCNWGHPLPWRRPISSHAVTGARNVPDHFPVGPVGSWI